MSDDPTTDDGGAADYRQVSFVVLAALALVLAAAFAPGLGGQNGSSPGSGADGGGEVEPSDDGEVGDGPTVEFDWRRLLEWFDFGSDDGTARETSDPACVITLDRTPVPGDSVTATIRYEGEPLADTPVWFNERRVGATDENGRLTGDVPYVETLVIRVGAGSDATCRARTSTSSTVTHGAVDRRSIDVLRQSRTLAATPAPNADTGGTAVTVPLAAAASTTTTLSADSTLSASGAALEPPRVQDTAAGNATGEVEVTGEVEIDVHGEPYPGETITVEAAIEGVPMRRATVSVDGTTVGETAADGTAAVTVPDDGTAEFELGVTRGDFAGTTTVHVLLLEATLTPDGLAPIPGSDGAVNATINGTPVEGAEVTVGGESAGTTDADGRLPIGLPRDPTTTVTVSTDGQTASVSLLGQYGPLAFLLALVVAGFAGLSYRWYGRPGPIAVVGTAAALLAVLVVEAFYGPRAGLAAFGATILLGLGIGVSGSDVERPRVGTPPSVRDWLGRLETRLVDLALRAVSRVEAVLEWGLPRIDAVRAWLRTLPRSVSGLGLRIAAWLGTLPGRARARLRGGLRTVRALQLRTVAIGVATVPLIGGGYTVDGVRGAVVVTVVLAAAGLVARRAEEDGSETTATATADAVDSTSVETAATEPTDEPRSFRELWRAFARRIAPRRWRTRTPGEIERRALAKEYPREPVRELTTLFREVEYGDRPRSSGHRDRAADAYDEIERARGRDADTDRPGEGDGDSTATPDSETETESTEGKP